MTLSTEGESLSERGREEEGDAEIERVNMWTCCSVGMNTLNVLDIFGRNVMWHE